MSNKATNSFGFKLVHRWSLTDSPCHIQLCRVKSSWFLWGHTNTTLGSSARRPASSPRCWKHSAATMHRSPHWTRYLWLWRERLHHFLSSLELEDLKNKDLNCTLDFLRECVLTRAFWINMYFLEKDIFMHPSPNSKVQSTLALQRRWTTAPAKVQSRNHLLCYRKIGFALFLFTEGSHTDRMYC